MNPKEIFDRALIKALQETLNTTTDPVEKVKIQATIADRLKYLKQDYP